MVGEIIEEKLSIHGPSSRLACQSWLMGLHLSSIVFAFGEKVNPGRHDKPSLRYIFATLVLCQRPRNKANSIDPVDLNRAVAPPRRKE